jgi:hypothetical protein
MAAILALEQNLSKHSDFLYSKYLKKQEKKLRKKKSKEQFGLLQQDNDNKQWNEAPNIDAFIAGGPSLGNSISPDMPLLMKQQSSQQAPPRQWTNIDFKRPKIDVYVANDIFN